MGHELGATRYYPPFLEEHVLMHWLFILVWVVSRVICHPSTGGKGSCYVGWSIPHQKGRLPHPCFQHGGYLPISLPPFYLALPTVTQFHDWSHPFWGSPSASVNRYRRHSLCLTYVFLLKSAAKSLYLWSSPILGGCSSTCPWEKLQLPIFPPQGSFTGRSLGDHLTTFFLWHSLFITSDRGSLVCVWGWYTCPMYDGCPYTRECQSLMQ